MAPIGGSRAFVCFDLPAGTGLGDRFRNGQREIEVLVDYQVLTG